MFDQHYKILGSFIAGVVVGGTTFWLSAKNSETPSNQIQTLERAERERTERSIGRTPEQEEIFSRGVLQGILIGGMGQG